MKKLIIISLVLLSLGLQAQINIPQISGWEKIGDTIVHLDTFNMVKRGVVANDSIIHKTTEYPYFVSVATKNQKWHELSETKPDTINGKRYIPNRKPIYYILRSGGLIIAQSWRIEIPSYREYSISQKIYRYLKLAFDGGYNVNQLNNYAPFDTLIHWDEYHTVPIDTTVIDTIN